MFIIIFKFSKLLIIFAIVSANVSNEMRMVSLLIEPTIMAGNLVESGF